MCFSANIHHEILFFAQARMGKLDSRVSYCVKIFVKDDVLGFRCLLVKLFLRSHLLQPLARRDNKMIRRTRNIRVISSAAVFGASVGLI